MTIGSFFWIKSIYITNMHATKTISDLFLLNKNEQKIVKKI